MLLGPTTFESVFNFDVLILLGQSQTTLKIKIHFLFLVDVGPKCSFFLDKTFLTKQDNL